MSYNDVIDHVVVSNDLLPYYIPNSAALLSDVAGLVTNYGSTTTDHYPAFSRYIFRNTTAPTVGSCTATVQFCANGTDTYTVPAFVANDDCDTELIYTYTITGATERSGNANDASGLFNIGVSVINWTATDSWGNSVTCQTTVTVNEAPSVLIPDVYVLPAGTMANTVYIGYAPASTATLNATAAGGTAPYGYSWSTGSTNASIQVSPTTNTQYKVTITDANGCQAMDSLMIQVKNVRGGKRGDKVIICYKPTGVANTLEVFPALVPFWIGQGAVLGSCSENGVPDYLLKVSLAPNPTVNQFRLNIQSNNPTDPIVIRVRDIFGRLVELRQVPAGTTQVFIGQNYHAGLYFIEVIQGPERVVLRGLKLR
ncbi:MAG: T9SS type A sorting domain-containing protein [Chitinophagaceae bacterium]|nr:T9SS type A sorting domain-containing protein [Chitinophagaceae bacterium]